MNIGTEKKRVTVKPLRVRRQAPLALPEPAPIPIPAGWPTKHQPAAIPAPPRQKAVRI